MTNIESLSVFPMGDPDGQLAAIIAYLKFEIEENESGVRHEKLSNLRHTRLLSTLRVIEFYREVRNDPACLRQMSMYAGFREP